MRLSAPSTRTALFAGLKSYVRRSVTVDTRALAAFRMFAALLILADVTLRSRNFSFYYTDDGAVSQDLAQLFSGTDAFSVFFWTQDPQLIAALFVLHAVVALFLLVGYQTRIALVVSFLFVISLDHHNPFVLSYADTLFRMLLFWAIFLPLGERWSIDALQASRPPRQAVASLATAAILVQMVTMYFVNAMHKFPSSLWQSGEAAVYVFGIDEMTFLIADHLRDFPLFLEFGGLMWFYLLLASPLMLVLHDRHRMMYAFLLMGGHLAFAVTVRIGAFAYVGILGLLLFLQLPFWSDAKATFRFLLPGDDPVGEVHRRIVRTVTPVAEALPRLHPDIPGEREVRQKLSVLAVAFAIFFVLIIPLAGMGAEGAGIDDHPIPEETEAAAFFDNFGVSQPDWSIFAGPHPRSIDRWYAFPAKTSDGDIIDIYNDREMTWERPYHELQRQHDAYRERFWMNSVQSAGQDGWVSTALGEYLCENHAADLEEIHMWEIRERITPATIDSPEDRDVRYNEIHRHACDGQPSDPLVEPPESDW